jgi:hypothetical protein
LLESYNDLNELAIDSRTGSLLKNFETTKTKEFMKGAKIVRNPMAKSTEVTKNLFKLASGEKRREKEPENPLIELRQLIGRDKQMIRDGLVAQAKRKHEEIHLHATDYLKASSPMEDTKREADEL